MSEAPATAMPCPALASKPARAIMAIFTRRWLRPPKARALTFSALFRTAASLALRTIVPDLVPQE